jgi:AraC-like DNA-binding protein
MGVIATLLPDPRRASRLRAAVAGRHAIVECADAASLLDACVEHAVHMVVVDYRAGGRLDFDGIRFIRSSYPRIVLVAYVEAKVEQVREIFDAGRYGFDGLVIFDRDDEPHALWRVIEHAEARGLAAQVRRTIGDVNASARDALLACVTRAHEGLSPDGLALQLGIGRRLLARYLAEAHFPRPQRLITWGRLVVAAYMLEDVKRSADAVAHALQFPSGSAFRNACQRYLNSTPHELRERGGSAHVMALLLAEIARNDQHPDDNDSSGEWQPAEDPPVEPAPPPS